VQRRNDEHRSRHPPRPRRAAAAAGAPGPDGGGFDSRGGPVDGETHVPGTVTGVTADSVTVQGDDGTTATYTVDASTQVLDDGQAMAVTDLASGDEVLVDVIPATDGGNAYAERVLAGTSATDGPGGPPPGQAGAT
jgi:hypothetical protein